MYGDFFSLKSVAAPHAENDRKSFKINCDFQCV